MKIIRLAIVAAVALTACTRVVDAQPTAQVSVAPIVEAQVRDLLSEDAQQQPVTGVGVYTGVDPVECAALVQEADAPVIFDANPVVNDGGYRPGGTAGIIEIAGVYHSTFDARAALDQVHRAIDDCQGTTLVSAGDDGTEPDDFVLAPPMDSGSPDIAVWSVTATNNPWTCDNAFTAKYNAAVFITACGDVGGYDVLTLADGALDRMNALVNEVS